MSEEKQTVCGAISKVTSAQRDAERHHIVQVSFQEGIRGTITFLEEKIFRYDVSREGSVSEYAAPRDEAHTAKIQQRPDSSDAYMKPEAEVTEDPVSVCIRCKETCIVFEKETGRMTIYVGKRKILEEAKPLELRDETIQTLIQYDKCQNNSLLLWLLNRKTDISSEPLLNSIHVQLRNPQTIVVQVNEEKLSGYVQSEDEYIYVNDSGKIVLKQTEKLQDVLLLSGITADTAEVGEQLVSDDTGVFADFLDIAAILRSEAITADSLGKSDDGGYYIVMGTVKVLLGKDIYMEEKISELNDLLSKLEGLSGTLHLEEYDSTKDSIIFTKDS